MAKTLKGVAKKSLTQMDKVQSKIFITLIINNIQSGEKGLNFLFNENDELTVVFLIAF